MTMPDGLLRAAQNYLDITWEDPDGYDKLSGILQRGITLLDHIAGEPLDYSTETPARALLFDYARYVRAGALQDFERDFSGELLGLNIDGAVRRYVQDTGGCAVE